MMRRSYLLGGGAFGFDARLGLDDIDQFLLGMNPHLLIDMVCMGLHGPLRDDKLIGDVLCIASFCEKDEYFSFARSEIEPFCCLDAFVFIGPCLRHSLFLREGGRLRTLHGDSVIPVHFFAIVDMTFLRSDCCCRYIEADEAN